MNQRESSSPDREPGASADRGRSARRPSQIPRRGWRDVLLRVKEEISRDNLSMISAGVAFFWLAAIFPAIAALIGIYGLATDPQQLQQQLEAVGRLLPQQAQSILSQQARRILQQPATTQQLAAVLGFLGSLWATAKGTKALMQALNIVYDERERRGFFKLNGLALLLTIGAMVGGALALTLVVALPAILASIGLGDALRILLSVLRWVLLAGLVVLGLGLAYRYGPSRDRPRWRWVSPGAVVATLLWLLASGLFSWYVASFGSYDETYGSVGAVIILLTWFYLTAYLVLLGGELNAEVEHQTREDSTTGEPEPMGSRGAHVADTLGETP